MKKVFIFLLPILGIFLGCQPSKPTLHVYNWADYLAPQLIERFEKQYQCKIVIDTFDSNEAMYAKLKAGATGYDVLFPSSYMVALLKRENLIQRLDHSLIPNLSNIDSTYLNIVYDPKMEYSVPYAVSITGVAYLRNRVPNIRFSWDVFARKDLKGRMTMLDDMRETIGAALKFLGYSLNTRNEQELQKARNVVLQWKRNLAKFENEQYKTGIASEEFFVVHGYSGDIFQIMAENPNVDFFVPEEGTSLTMDEMVIMKTSKQVKLAHAFINFLLDPHNAAENIAVINYLCPNRAAYPLLDESLRHHPVLFPPETVLAKCELIEDLGEDNVKYTKIWDEIKAMK